MRFGIIGTNFISDRFLSSLPFTESKATAVLSRREETGRAYAEKHGIGEVFTDRAAFFASDAFDAVYVASPNLCHEADSIEAAEAGKHVLCEKPAAPTLASFLRMRAAADKAGVVLMEAMRPLFDSTWERLRDLIPSLGKIRAAHFDYCQYSSRYDRFKAGEVLRAFDPSYQNAAILDIGVYPIAVCARLFGKPLSVQSRSVILENGFEGGGSLLLGYGDFNAVVSYSKITESIAPSCLLGENGSLSFDRVSEPHEALFSPRAGEKQTILRAPTDAPDNMYEEILAFEKAVKGEGDALLSVTEISLSIIDEALKQNGIDFDKT
ncbi:MAG: Gfo/Idh/MocA family oxidoreductase [Clostridia bacterium]|nr:Gfo/Idh/MocA family oxidoreductase [Clostridia bacterium]